jgi:phosphatidate cytidylyltransferase
MFQNLLDRIRTIFVLAPVVLLCLLYTQTMIWLGFVCILLNWYEFLGMSANPKEGPAKFLVEAVLLGALLVLATFSSRPLLYSLVIYLSFSAQPLCHVFRGLEGRMLRNILWRMLGLFFFCLPMQLGLSLHNTEVLRILTDQNGISILLSIVISIWGTDISGLVVGKSIGNRKLAPAIRYISYL